MVRKSSAVVCQPGPCRTITCWTAPDPEAASAGRVSPCFGASSVFEMSLAIPEPSMEQELNPLASAICGRGGHPISVRLPTWAHLSPPRGFPGVESAGRWRRPSGSELGGSPRRDVPQTFISAQLGQGFFDSPSCLARVIHTVKADPQGPLHSVASDLLNPRCWIAQEYSTDPIPTSTLIRGCG